MKRKHEAQADPKKQDWRHAFNDGLDIASLRLGAARAMVAALAQPYHDQTIAEMEHRLGAHTLMEALCGVGEFLDQAEAGLNALAQAYEDGAPSQSAADFMERNRMIAPGIMAGPVRSTDRSLCQDFTYLLKKIETAAGIFGASCPHDATGNALPNEPGDLTPDGIFRQIFRDAKSLWGRAMDEYPVTQGLGKLPRRAAARERAKPRQGKTRRAA